MTQTQTNKTGFQARDRVYLVSREDQTGEVLAVMDGAEYPVTVRWDGPLGSTTWEKSHHLEYWTRPESGAAPVCDECGCSRWDVRRLAQLNGRGPVADAFCCEVIL